MNESDKIQPTPINSVKLLVAHVFWMLLGPAILFAIMYANTTEDNHWFSAVDLAFVLVLGLVVFARWVDQRSGQCTLADGQASTWKDFRRFVYVFVSSAVSIWAITNVIGNHLV